MYDIKVIVLKILNVQFHIIKLFYNHHFYLSPEFLSATQTEVLYILNGPSPPP